MSKKLHECLVLTLVGAMAAGACVFYLSQSVVAVTDDAFITYRCARNLAEGNGLVYNVGVRVEGSTSLLWALLVAVPIKLGLPCDQAAIAMGCFCGVLAAVALAYLAWRLSGSAAAALVASGLLCVQPSYWTVVGNGMESGLYALTLAGMVFLLLAPRPAWATVPAGVLLYMTRPESAFLWGLAALYWGLEFRAADARPARRRAVRILLAWAAGALLVTAWRYAYYGDIIPNTVRAKSVPLDLPVMRKTVDMGVRYLRNFAQHIPLLIAASVAGFALAFRRRAVWLLTAILLVAAAVTLRNGGDHMRGFRLLTVYLPLLVTGTAFLAAPVIRMSRRLPLRGASGALCGLFFAWWVFRVGQMRQAVVARVNPDILFWRNAQPPEDPYSAFAKAILPNLQEGDLISASNIGRFGWIAFGYPVHDRFGLVDPYIARHGEFMVRYGKINPDYTINVARPDVMVASRPELMKRHLPPVYRGDFERDWTYFAYRYSPARSLYGIVANAKKDRILKGVSWEPLPLGEPGPAPPQ